MPAATALRHAFVSQYPIHLFPASRTQIIPNFFWEWNEYHDSVKNSAFVRKHLKAGPKSNPDPDPKNLFRKYNLYLWMTQFCYHKMLFP